jgi:hypothetical protein
MKREVHVHPWEHWRACPLPDNVLAAFVFCGQRLQLCLDTRPVTVQYTRGTRRDNYWRLELYSKILGVLSYSGRQSITRETEDHMFSIPLFFKHQTDHPDCLTAQGATLRVRLTMPSSSTSH